MKPSLVVEEGAFAGDKNSEPAPVAALRRDRDTRPDPEWVRGRCPDCGDDLVSNLYYVGGKGYILCWECWGSLGENPACWYRKVL